ncbi:U-box domain-containing protein 4 [Phtheirospermum japonicum]|uniref:U-box domain-containing protein 4 n=1 Tax=Phtheirospermum japonicum TaxID=374723 RepID=A0A830CVF9_9LAMI|nr:U-box domain-containing protein 4 [Phtheirospermum japonicum]
MEIRLLREEQARQPHQNRPGRGDQAVDLDHLLQRPPIAGVRRHPRSSISPSATRTRRRSPTPARSSRWSARSGPPPPPPPRGRTPPARSSGSRRWRRTRWRSGGRGRSRRWWTSWRAAGSGGRRTRARRSTRCAR